MDERALGTGVYFFAGDIHLVHRKFICPIGKQGEQAGCRVLYAVRQCAKHQIGLFSHCDGTQSIGLVQYFCTGESGAIKHLFQAEGVNSWR